MRILTVRQPWAWAIIHGGKDVENRVRNIAGTYRGPIAIHAGMREDTSARQHPEIIRLAADQWWTDPASLLTGRRDQFGTIIGVVDLFGVHEERDCWTAMAARDGTTHEEHCSAWAEAGDVFHLVLANPRPIADPILFTGALGLRTLDEATATRVWEAIS